MKNKIIILITLFISSVFAQDDLLINTFNRKTKSLNGCWKYIVDPYENGFYNYRYQAYDQFENPGRSAFFMNAKQTNKTDLIEYNFDLSDSILVPGDWNSQKEKLFYYEGTVWYKKSFDYKKSDTTNRLFLYFDAVNYQADVYLNGKKLGWHRGGFTPFNFEVTELIKEKDNFLVVKVDNKRKKDAVPTLNTDWWNYGGITRDVKVVEVPATFIQDYFLQLDENDNQKISAEIKLAGVEVKSKAITVLIPELKFEKKLKTNDLGIAQIDVKVKNIRYWSTENPKLYQVEIKAGDDALVDHIGFRTIKTKGSKILLNNKEIFLKGISIHEENPLRGGRAWSQDDAQQLLSWAQELGCNYVRLAHYPHNENMARLADKMGIMVWEEIPVYWTIDWKNSDTYLNAETQLKEVVARDKNRASVIIWSMANETPVSAERNTFLQNLIKMTRSLDDSRLISAALELSGFEGNPLARTIEDPIAKFVDVLSFNQYIGWYDGLPDKCAKIEWKIQQNKPVIISEFGGGAKYGLHQDKLSRWSEEYQEYIYQENIKMLQRIPQLQGMSPWILVDFRSPRRPLPQIQDGWNRKGLLSDKGEKKKAYFILQEFYKIK